MFDRCQHWNYLSATFLVVIVAIAAAFVIEAIRSDEGGYRAIVVDPEPVALSPGPTLGSEAAAILLVVFSDFQCPYCRQVAIKTMPLISPKYVTTGQVQVMFKHLPLSQLHPLAVSAARLSECARAISDASFWRAHDEIFSAMILTEAVLDRIATGMNLGPRPLEECGMSPATTERLRVDTADAGLLGVRSTPTIFLARRRPDGTMDLLAGFAGLVSASVLDTAIERFLETGE